MRSYIGVSGLTRREDADALLASIDLTPSDGPDLMVGVLVSAKTVTGALSHRPKRYPTIDEVSAIFPRHVRALNLVHYATEEPDTLGDQLVAHTRRLDSTVLHGFQINVTWPDPKELEKHYAACGRWHMVLQIGPAALREVDDDPREIARRLGCYGGLIDRVLFDGSGGEGVPLDPDRLRPMLTETLLRMPDLGIGIAGGLGPWSLHLAAPLVREFPDLSLDAESALREHVTDEYFPAAAHEYLMQSLHLVR